MRVVRLIWLLSIICAPAEAKAVPVFTAIAAYLAPIASSISVALGGSVITAASIGAWGAFQFVMAVSMVVYGTVQKNKAKKAAQAAKDAYNASLSDRTVTAVAADIPYTYAYGEVRVGSAIVAVFTSGDKDQYKWLVCIHAAHEVTSIDECWIAGKKVAEYTKESTGSKYETWSGNTHILEFTPEKIGAVKAGDSAATAVAVPYSLDGNTITLTDSYAFASCAYTQTQENTRAWVWHHLGTDDDPVDPELHAAFPALWPATSVLRGFCYTVVKLDLNQTEFQGGVPTVEVLMRGKKLYDPRSGLTVYSTNNALVALDYLIGDLCGVELEDLPISRYIAAANVCDEAISIGNRYTFNGTITSNDDRNATLDKIAQSMAGSIVSTTFDIFAGKYTAPVMHLTQTDIVGKLSVTPGVSDSDLFNGVKGQYTGAETQWVVSDIKPFQNAAYKAADGGDEWVDLSFPFTDELQRIHNLSRIFVESQRNGFTPKSEFSRKTWKLRVGDRITMTIALPTPVGMTLIEDKVFQVKSRKFSPTTAVELILKEDAESIWDEADAVAVDDTPNSSLPDPFHPPKITGLVLSAGISDMLEMSDGTTIPRIRASWDAPTFTGVVEVEFGPSDGGAWSRVTSEEDSVYLSPVVDSVSYYVRVRARNSFNGVSDWTYAHVVVDEWTVEPDAPTSLSYFFADTSTTTATVTVEWASAHVVGGVDYCIINNGVKDVQVKANTYTEQANWLGTRVYTVRTVDRRGNVSEAASINVTKYAPGVVTDFRAEVIDNNVLLYWQAPAKTSLPVNDFEFRRGEIWETATVIGLKAGGFTSIFETVGGVKQYWIAAIDTDGVYGEAVSLSTTVSQPPDYILHADINSTFGGTKSNALAENSALIVPVNTTETWAEHFTSRGWSTPQDQINAGYPIFIQPSNGSGYYEETTDYGTVLAGTKVTVTLDGVALAGSMTSACVISVSADGTTWTDFAGWSYFATNFRYVKVRVTFTASTAASLYKVNGLNIRLDAKLKNDAGSVAAVSTDVGGTQVNFNMDFVDVTSIGLTPLGTTPLTAVYDFTDAPNPTGFKVLLFNAAGARVSGTVSWSAKGY